MKRIRSRAASANLFTQRSNAALASAMTPGSIGGGHDYADALAFTVPLSLVRLRTYKAGAAGRLRIEKRRAAIREALTSTHPNIKPVMGDVIVHVTAEVPRAAAVPDVDNLLKPVLDAMTGIVYLDDTQVVECLIVKIPSHESRMKVEIWGTRLPQ